MKVSQYAATLQRTVSPFSGYLLQASDGRERRRTRDDRGCRQDRRREDNEVATWRVAGKAGASADDEYGDEETQNREDQHNECRDDATYQCAERIKQSHVNLLSANYLTGIPGKYLVRKISTLGGKFSSSTRFSSEGSL